jgi:hypothetical protein
MEAPGRIQIRKEFKQKFAKSAKVSAAKTPQPQLELEPE